MLYQIYNNNRAETLYILFITLERLSFKILLYSRKILMRYIAILFFSFYAIRKYVGDCLTPLNCTGADGVLLDLLRYIIESVNIHWGNLTEGKFPLVEFDWE